MYVMEIHGWISSITDTLRNQGLLLCQPNCSLSFTLSLSTLNHPPCFHLLSTSSSYPLCFSLFFLSLCNSCALCTSFSHTIHLFSTTFSLVSQPLGRMSWSLDLLPLPPCVELGGPPLSSLLWTLLLLFLWYCYRVGADPPSCSTGSAHSALSCSSSCSPVEPGHCTPKPSPAIAVESEEEEEAKSYLMPVLSHAPFPAQAAAGSRKLYTSLQEYAKRYSWAGMGRIHKGLRIQVRHI